MQGLGGKSLEKLANDIKNYMSSKPNQQIPRRQEVRRVEPPQRTPEKLQTMSTVSSQVKDLSKSQVKTTTFTIELLYLNTRQVSYLPKMRVTVKNKRVTYEIGPAGEQFKYKIEVKPEDCTIELGPDNSIILYAKKVDEFKNQSGKKGPPQWSSHISITNPKDNIINVTLGGEGKAANLRNEFSQRLKEEGFIIKAEEIVEPKIEMKEDNTELEKIKRQLAATKEEDKTMLLVDFYKIKKQYEFTGVPAVERLKCPVHLCSKTFQQVNQMRAHIKKQHPEISKLELDVNDDGTFKFGQKALDFALIMGKLHPGEVKTVIKQMKQKNSEYIM